MVSHIQVELFKLYRQRATRICLAGVFFWTAFGLIMICLALVREYIFAQIGGNEVSIFQLGIDEQIETGFTFFRTLPDQFRQGQWLPYLLYGEGNDLLITIADVLVIVCLASMLELGRFRGIVRLLLGHGLRRAQYTLAQGIALLIYLLGLWMIVVLLEALLSQALLLVHGFPGWQAAYWLDVARVVGGNALWHFVLVGVVYLTVAVFHSPVIGVLGGFVYRFYLHYKIHEFLSDLAGPQWARYTPEIASKTLLDPTLPLSGSEVVLWWLVLFTWGAACFALAALCFDKRDFV